MVVWTLFTLVVVLGVKYYTSLEMRKLERRLETVKLGLNQVKDKLKVAQDRQDEAEGEAGRYAERMRVMKEIIQDLNVRLSSSDPLMEDKVLISDSVRPPVF